MAWVVTAAGTLKGTRPQPKLATHCTKPIHEAVGNGFPKKAPRVRLRRYSTCSHENLFLGKKFRKSKRARQRSKVHAPSRCWGPMAPAEALRRSLAGGLRKSHGYGYWAATVCVTNLHSIIAHRFFLRCVTKAPIECLARSVAVSAHTGSKSTLRGCKV